MPHLPAPPDSSSLSPGELRIAHHEGGGGWCVVEVDGEVDLASAPALRAALGDLLDRCGYRRFAIELSRVGHLDSSGLGVLIAFRKRLRSEGSLVLAGVQPNVLNVLRLTGLERTFEIRRCIDACWTSSEPTVVSDGLAGAARPA